VQVVLHAENPVVKINFKLQDLGFNFLSFFKLQIKSEWKPFFSVRVRAALSSDIAVCVFCSKSKLGELFNIHILLSDKLVSRATALTFLM